jgi:thiaminase
MPFFQVIRTRFTPKIAEIFEHPFNQKLCNGELPKVLFMSFLSKDVRYYLPAYADALLDIKLLSQIHEEQFAQLEVITRAEILRLTHHYPEALNIPSARCFGFFHFEDKSERAFEAYATSFSKPGTLPEKIARITPCLWSFQQIGQRFDLSACAIDNPYRSWLETYQDPGFVAATDALVDTLAQLYRDADLTERQAIEQAFSESRVFFFFFVFCMFCRGVLFLGVY